MTRRVYAFIAAAALLVLPGCERKEAAQELFAMDTYMEMRASGKEAEAALADAAEEIRYLEECFSVSKEESDIYRLNHAEGKPVEVQEDTAALLSEAKAYGEDTAGALDITIAPVLRAWGFTTGEYKIPAEAELTALLAKVDYRQVLVEGSTVQLPEGVALDLGAVAKGYAGDKVTALLKERGITSAMINLGGNVQTLGKKADGSEWTVGIADPFAPDQTMCTISGSDMAVVTSGNYERYFTGEDGKRYCHIIDPKTGYPAESGLVSATVIGESGVRCDALSTALFVMGKEDALAYWQAHRDFEMILVTREEEIYYTAGLAGTLENVSDMPAAVMEG